MLRETDFPQFINLKCLRLNPPNLNKLITPLNGLYNDINNKEDINVFPLEKKTSNFSLSSNNLNIENVFIINEKFGKVYFSEIFEAILIFINTSNYYEIELKNIEIVIAIEVKKKLLRVRFQSDIPQNIIYIKPLESYGIKIRFKIETNYKYLIDTYAICQCKYYDEIIAKDDNKGLYRIFNKTEKYQISNGRVELNFVRRFTFDGLTPFSTQEKYINQLKNCIIEQTINQMNILK